MSATTTETTASSTITSISASTSQVGGGLYDYNPSVALAGVAIALFGVTGIVLSYEICTKYFELKKRFNNGYTLKETKKQKKFLGLLIYIPLFVGVLLEIGGYASRVYSGHRPSNLGAFVAQIVLILVSPGLMSATSYMIFHNLTEYLNCPTDSGVSFFVKDSLMVKLFVIADTASFLLQCAGGGLMSQNSSMHLGETIIIIGLFIQLASFGLFFVIQFNFTFNYKKYSKNEYYSTLNNHWKYLNYILIFSSFCILLRSIVRVAEFLQGFSGEIQTHEFFLYVFDALPMLFVVISMSASFFYTNIGELLYLHHQYTYAQSQEKVVASAEIGTMFEDNTTESLN